MDKRTDYTEWQQVTASASSGDVSVDSLPFDVPLPASVLNIEERSRTNLFPWRGQFSPQLVEALLRAYAPPRSVVLDPFMGSGIVLVESARLACPAYGVEVNPAAYLLGRVYELCNAAGPERDVLLRKAEAVLTKMRPTAFDLPLFSTAGAGVSARSLDHPGWVPQQTDPRVRMLLEALIVLLDEDIKSDQSYVSRWATIRKIVLGLPYTATPVRAIFGDARQIPLPDTSVDFVLSSPPYINVFNYHHNFRPQIESLGWKPLVVARSEIGSNRKFRQNRFLTVIQYCIDMALALAELRRVCTNSARIILVLGKESNVHKTPFYNGHIMEHLAVEVIGLHTQLRQQRVFLNRFGQRIYEDLLHLSPGHTGSPRKDELIKDARNVAKAVLMEARGRVPIDRRHYLEEAIDRAGEVEPSPILEPSQARGAVQ